MDTMEKYRLVMDSPMLPLLDAADSCRYKPAPYLPMRVVARLFVGTFLMILSAHYNLRVLRRYGLRDTAIETIKLLWSRELFAILVALCDLTQAFIYPLVHQLSVLTDVTDCSCFGRMWTFSTPLSHDVGHCAGTFGALLVVAASVERLLIRIGWKPLTPALPFIRVALVLVAAGATAALKLDTFYQYEIIHQPQCAGLVFEYFVESTKEARENAEDRIMVAGLTPFIMILVLNGFTMLLPKFYKCLADRGYITAAKKDETMEKISTKAASRILWSVVLAYFIGNAVKVIVGVWEAKGMKSLKHFPEVHPTLVKLGRLLSLLAGIIRPIRYESCRRALEKDLADFEEKRKLAARLAVVEGEKEEEALDIEGDGEGLPMLRIVSTTDEGVEEEELHSFPYADVPSSSSAEVRPSFQ